MDSSSSLSASPVTKLIFIIGATGAQGIPVVRALLAPTPDGKPSPWRVRALSRDLTHHRVVKLQKLGVEFLQGSFMDFDVVRKGMEGAYGAYINTDGFTVGAQAELHAGIRIYEIAQRQKVQHFVWSGLDYASKKGNWDPSYYVDHYDGKGRVTEFLKSQPNGVNGGPRWTVFTNGPYMDMLAIGLFSPLNTRADGTVVFAAPIGDGHVPMIALSDLGWWARHIFDSPSTTTGKDLEVCSQVVSWPEIVETFKRVTGKKAEYKRLTIDEYYDLYSGADLPISKLSPTTYRQNFGAFWRVWRDDIIQRDMNWIKQVHPGTMSLEQWMRVNKYDGSRKMGLKNVEDLNMVGMRPTRQKLAKL